MAGAFWAESRLAVLLLCGGAANGLGGCSRVPGMLVLLATARFRAQSDARALPLGPIFKRLVWATKRRLGTAEIRLKDATAGATRGKEPKQMGGGPMRRW